MKKLELKQLTAVVGGEYDCIMYHDGKVICRDSSIEDGSADFLYAWLFNDFLFDIFKNVNPREIMLAYPD